jgi:protein subunit release factor A
MLIAEQKEAVRKLRERARDQANEQVSEGSEREVGEIEMKIRQIEDQIQQLKIPNDIVS